MPYMKIPLVIATQTRKKKFYHLRAVDKYVCDKKSAFVMFQAFNHTFKQTSMVKLIAT